jgi:hypothetical protein
LPSARSELNMVPCLHGCGCCRHSVCRKFGLRLSFLSVRLVCWLVRPFQFASPAFVLSRSRLVAFAFPPRTLLRGSDSARAFPRISFSAVPFRLRSRLARVRSSRLRLPLAVTWLRCVFQFSAVSLRLLERRFHLPLHARSSRVCRSMLDAFAAPFSPVSDTFVLVRTRCGCVLLDFCALPFAGVALAVCVAAVCLLRLRVARSVRTRLILHSCVSFPPLLARCVLRSRSASLRRSALVADAGQERCGLHDFLAFYIAFCWACRVRAAVLVPRLHYQFSTFGCVCLHAAYALRVHFSRSAFDLPVLCWLDRVLSLGCCAFVGLFRLFVAVRLRVYSR